MDGLIRQKLHKNGQLGPQRGGNDCQTRVRDYLPTPAFSGSGYLLFNDPNIHPMYDKTKVADLISV